MPVEDIGQLISSQLHVRPQVGPRPAHSHLTRGDRFKLKVPASTLHRIGFLCPEDTHPGPSETGSPPDLQVGPDRVRGCLGSGSQDT